MSFLTRQQTTNDMKNKRHSSEDLKCKCKTKIFGKVLYLSIAIHSENKIESEPKKCVCFMSLIIVGNLGQSSFKYVGESFDEWLYNSKGNNAHMIFV